MAKVWHSERGKGRVVSRRSVSGARSTGCTGLVVAQLSSFFFFFLDVEQVSCLAMSIYEGTRVLHQGVLHVQTHSSLMRSLLDNLHTIL